VLLLTTLDAWRVPGAQFNPADGQAAWVTDEKSALAVADDVFPAGQVIVLTLDPEPGRVPPPGVIDRARVARIRYARRGPQGRHTALLDQPNTAKALDLLPHPEGGWFRETWRTDRSFSPEGYQGERSSATGIYFLLPPGEESIWHVVASDEVWFWHGGGPLTLLLGGEGDRPDAASARTVTLGSDLAAGQVPQALVPAGRWQAAKPATAEEVLVSCVVSPGFDFADFRA
jgi:predicted cupin superfamily sugar epimerase